MELSAEQFIEIVSAVAADENDQFEGDQRRQPRIGLNSRAAIIPLADGSQPLGTTIQVRDISPLGIGFLHDQKMALDEQFALVLPRSGDTPSVVLCSVAFWQPLSNNLYAIGARFRRILRDGGDPPLPIRLDTPTADLADEIGRLHRAAS